jgi:flagellar basal-body rod modification protein FlgD
MSRIPNVGTFPPADQLNGGASQGIQDLDLNKFIDLMIAELQNQDPLNPLDNNEMLQQITQIREIGASDKLSSTLDAVLMGQNLTTASSLIGKEVNALGDDNANVQGLVDRVSIEVDDAQRRSLRIHVGESSVKLENIREVVGGG